MLMDFRTIVSVASTGLLLLTSQVVLVDTASAQNSRKALTRAVDLEAGKELFQREWVHEPVEQPQRGDRSLIDYRKELQRLPGDGLGPMFNATSCEACHAAGGASDVDRNVTLVTLDPRSKGLKRGSKEAKKLMDLFPAFVATNGTVSVDVVVHESSARPFYDQIRDQLTKGIPGGMPNGWFDRTKRSSQVIAENPVVAGRQGDFDFYLSQRNSPPLFGMGLIDKITMYQLKRLASALEKRSGGKVSGRVGLGKFGWRAQTPTLSSFVAGACAGELGLNMATSPQSRDMADNSYASLGEDISQRDFISLVNYVAALPAPARATGHVMDVAEGERLFAKIGCTHCHIKNVSPAIGIYSDLLLHDMGDLLQAPSPVPTSPVGMTLVRMPIVSLTPNLLRPTGSIAGYYGHRSSSIPTPYAFGTPAEPAFPRGTLPESLINTNLRRELTWDMLQREWRTPPLWGVADSGPYLHDGRATTLDAAIRWHGGEASTSTEKYRSLDRKKRKMVLQFLGSLRAPATVEPGPADSEAFVQKELNSTDVTAAFARGY